MRGAGLQSLIVTTLVALLLSLMLLLSSCYLFVGSPTDLVPLPNNVEMLDPPLILSCNTTMIQRTCEDRFERVCGWYYWTEPNVQTPSTGWIYSCRDVWSGTDCLYDIAIRLVVSDPSNDLDSSKLPRVRVFDSEPAQSSLSVRNCLLDIPQTDIVIQPSSIEGSGLTKTISVRLKDVLARFNGNCSSFSATLRFAIVFDIDGEELSSTNAIETVVACDRPYTTPIYLYSDTPNLLGPYNERPAFP